MIQPGCQLCPFSVTDPPLVQDLGQEWSILKLDEKGLMMSEGPAQECADDDDLESEKGGTEVPLPDEVVSIIIGHVISDPSVFEEPSTALGRLESVNRVWRGAALRMYRVLCRRRRKIRYPQLEPVFTWHNFDTDVYPGLTKGTMFS